MNLSECYLTNSNMEDAEMDDANLSQATLHLCTLDRVQAARANFTNARLEDSTAEAANFTKATFRSAHLTETSFSRAVLRETILDDAEGDGIDFRGADLRSASLKGVRFDEADFRGADLRNADLSHGRFHSADFRGAILDGANFHQADCSGADFDHGESPIQPESTAPSTPTVPVPAIPDPGEVAALQTLNEFLALLPAAVSTAEPDQIMSRLQELIDQTSASSGYSQEQQQLLHNFFSDVVKPNGVDTARLQQLLATLSFDSNEPPEEWKSWLEPLMKTAPKPPSSEKSEDGDIKPVDSNGSDSGESGQAT